MAQNVAEYSEDQFSRGIETAPTDTKSLTNTTERKTGKGSNRRRRKNINIRKLSKKNRTKKSTKSVAKPRECIQEKVEEEDEVDLVQNNDDLKDIENSSSLVEPKKVYQIGDTTSIRNTSIMNNGTNFSNRSVITATPGMKESRRARSIKKPVNRTVKTLNSMFSGRPATIFFQYPEYCGETRDETDITEYAQSDFKKLGYSLTFKVTGSTHIYNSIVNSMKMAGFQMVTGYVLQVKI